MDIIVVKMYMYMRYSVALLRMQSMPEKNVNACTCTVVLYAQL